MIDLIRTKQSSAYQNNRADIHIQLSFDRISKQSLVWWKKIHRQKWWNFAQNKTMRWELDFVNNHIREFKNLRVAIDSLGNFSSAVKMRNFLRPTKRDRVLNEL